MVKTEAKQRDELMRVAAMDGGGGGGDDYRK